MMQRGLTDKDRRRSATNECHALRDIVSKLRLELLQSQMETQKLQDQLQCIIYLVRRSWQGDELASVHVANIVGTAPPKIQKSSQMNEMTSTPKSTALNNWARLVIGLLNRMYQDEEFELRAKQLMYLRGREELLDEQLMSQKDVMHHQASVSVMQMGTLELLQVQEEEKARQRLEEREQLEQQKQELQAKFKRRKPPGMSHLYGQAQPSKDSVERGAELDVSQNFLITPVGRKEDYSHSKAGENSLKGDSEGRKNSIDAASRLSQGVNENKSSDDVFLTRRRTNSSSHDEENTSADKKHSRHVRSQTSEGTGKRDNTQSRPRPKTAVVKSSTVGTSGLAGKRRPVSAHFAQSKSFTKPPPAYDTSKTKRQLDLIERDLKLTTKALQGRLGISRQGFV